MASVYEALAHCVFFWRSASPSPPNQHAASRRPRERPAPAGSRSTRNPFYPGPFDEYIAGPLAETVPAYIKQLIAES